MNLILIGPQASGKGTHAAKINAKYHIYSVSMGYLLRNLKDEELRKEIDEKYLSKGILVPDELTAKILKDKLDEEGYKKGFILDGFPRTLNQAKILDNIIKIDLVIYTTLSHETIIKRLSTRRQCSKCGAVYNLKTNPPEKEGIIKAAEKEIELIESHFKRGLLSKEEKSSKVIEVWTKAKSEIEKLVPKTLPEMGSIFSMVDSGARGSWAQPVQMAGMKGLVINPAGQIIELPVKSSFKEGFDVLEYFISTHGARKGTADTALRTSTAGYLTRRLVDVSHEVVVFEEDCKDQEGFEIFKKDADELGQDLAYKVVGRIALEGIKGIV